MRMRAGMSGLDAALASESRRVFSVVDQEVKAGSDGLKGDLRQQTQDLLGTRVANAWRGKFYANDGDPKGPAGFVWSKAPRIIDFFSSSRLITPLGESFAIPTSNVPRGARGRRLTPIEVEARFNVELQPIRLPSGNLGLVMPAIDASSRRRPGLRSATAGRVGQGRAVRQVLMFVLIKGPLRSRKLIDLQATANRWGATVAGNIDRKLGLS